MPFYPADMCVSIDPIEAVGRRFEGEDECLLHYQQQNWGDFHPTVGDCLNSGELNKGMCALTESAAYSAFG